MRAARRRTAPNRNAVAPWKPVAATARPLGPGGNLEAQLARAMAEHLLAVHPGSASDALRHLRQAFPASPLAVRVGALAALMRR